MNHFRLQHLNYDFLTKNIKTLSCLLKNHLRNLRADGDTIHETDKNVAMPGALQ